MRKQRKTPQETAERRDEIPGRVDWHHEAATESTPAKKRRSTMDDVEGEEAEGWECQSDSGGQQTDAAHTMPPPTQEEEMTQYSTTGEVFERRAVRIGATKA